MKSVFEDCLENPPTDLNLISVDTPIPGATTSERGITISGSIENYQPTQTLSVNGFGAVIDASGDFTLTPFPLEVGNNSLEFLLFETGQSVAVESETLNLNYTPINEAVEPFTVAAGGTVTVDDTNSEIFGASFTVGPNSIRRDFLAYIEHDPEHVPNLPIEFTQVGEPLTLYPIAEGFSNPGVLSVPYDTSLLPDNTTTSGVFILALSDDGWVALDSFQGNFNTVSAEIDGSTYGAFIGVVETPIAADQFLIKSDPSYATIYVDGVRTGERTPVVLDNLDAGAHDVKLYLEGFNELFTTINVENTGNKSEFLLTQDQINLPVITLDQTLEPVFSTTEALLTLSGIASFEGAVMDGQTVIISHNGVDSYQATNFNGFFDGAIALKRGQNTVSVRTTASNGQTFSTPTYVITLGSPDITINLSWNTNESDLDMHVFDPDGAHAWFGELSGIPNGMIDRDDVDGFGPEIFTLSNPPNGTYRVNVDSYELGDAGSTRGTLEVRLGNSVIFNETYTFSSSDQNSGEGEGSSSSSFWQAFEFDVSELEITRIDFEEDSQPENAIFTTLDGENEITVNFSKPDDLDVSDITLEVRETNENFDVDTAGVSFEDELVRFDASHDTPTAAELSAGTSRALTYDVTLTAESQELESEAQTVTQDDKSHLRQEYVDKDEVVTGFARDTPTRGDIINAGGFPGSTYFTYNELAQFSDFGPGLSIIEDSVNIADTLRGAWGHPLRVTSGFRNPRRNDRLGGAQSSNSLHQSGDAVDLNPAWTSAGWPERLTCTDDGVSTEFVITTYEIAQDALTCLARSTFGANYDILFHANHLHIELDP